MIMIQTGFLEPVLEESHYVLQLFRGYNGRHEPYFAYILFPTQVMEALQCTPQQHWGDVEEFGVVLKRGSGHAPSSEDYEEARRIFREDLLKLEKIS